MRALKIMGLAVGAFVLVSGVALVAIALLFDPNDYKERIARSVKSATGRELSLPGNISLSVFPRLALEFGPASLGNPPGFDAEPFALVKRVALRVRLMPLLRKQVQIARIEIDGLDLRLQQNAAGKGNWEDFGADSPKDATQGGATQPLDLAGVRVTDGRIAFGDSVAEKVAIDIGRTTVDSQDRWRLDGVDLGGTLRRGADSPEIPWKFTTPRVSMDLGRQTLAAAAFEAQFAAAKISGSLNGTQIIDEPALQGGFALQPVALRELLGQLGVTPPVTRDTQVLSNLAARGTFHYGGDVLRAEGLVVQLDDSALRGSSSMNLASGAIDFGLAVDRLDFDRYLPPPSKAPAAGKKAPFELATESLKALLAKGELEIGQAKIAGVALSNLSLGLDSKEGVTHLSPLKAQLYGGQYAGDITVDCRGSLPELRLEQTMTGIDVAQLLTALAETKRLSGRGTVTTSLTAQGNNSDALIRSLRGKMAASLGGGAVEGFDLWYAVTQAQSLIEKQTLAGGTDSGRTAFDTFKISADVVGGIATTNDLNIVSQQLRITGKGNTNFATQAIDYQVTATVLKSAGGTLAAIPVGITGTLDKPKVRPDIEGIAKERVKQEIDKRKDELKEKLQDKLKELLGQ